jgi:hypothetical protein
MKAGRKKVVKATNKMVTKKPAAMRTAKGATTPKALICGMLERGDKMLFLVRKDGRGVERVEMPCVHGSTSTDPAGQLTEAFRKQTGIKAEMGNLRMEGRHNIGSKGKVVFVPVLVFEMSPDSPLVRPDPGKGIERCEWMTMMEAKGRQLTDNGMWLLEDTEIVEP